jgi:hypothetical protein
MHALLAVGEAQISETRHKTSTTTSTVVARRSSDLLHFVWFTAKPTMRELPHAIGRCSIARHLELNPSRSSVLWVIGLDARPAVAPPLTTMHPRMEVRATTRDEVLSGSVLARWLAPRTANCTDAYGQLTPQSRSGSYQDLLRLALMHAHGGTYLDLDVLPIAPLPAGDWVSQQLGHGRGADATPPLNNAAFAMAPRHPCVGALIEAADRTLRSCRFRTFWGMFGPELFSNVFDPGWREALAAGVFNQRESLGSRPPVAECAGVARLPPHVFSPIRWNRAKSFYRVSAAFNATWLSQQAAAGTRALHLYTSNLGLKGPSQSAAFLERVARLGLCPFRV